MKKWYVKQQLWPALLGLFILGLDQWSKALIVKHFEFGEYLPITSFFNLVLVYNKGAAFSFLAGHPTFAYWFFSILGILACLLFFYWSLCSKSGSQRFILWLVIGGALGNIIDRIRLGHVVDFLDFYVSQWHWPAFNVADSAIFIGMVLFILLGFKKPAQ